MVQPYVANGARVLDVGCSDGALFRNLGSRIGEGVGVDTDLDAPVEMPSFVLVPGTFPESLGCAFYLFIRAHQT